MKETGTKAILAAAIAGLCSYMGAMVVPLIVLVAVMIIDYATGMTKAWYTATLSSRIGVKGIIKKVGYLVIVAVAMVADWLIKSGLVGIGITWHIDFLISLVAIIWLIINECISIIENVASFGTPVPGFIGNIFGKLKQVTEDKGDSVAAESEGKKNA